VPIGALITLALLGGTLHCVASSVLRRKANAGGERRPEAEAQRKLPRGVGGGHEGPRRKLSGRRGQVGVKASLLAFGAGFEAARGDGAPTPAAKAADSGKSSAPTALAELQRNAARDYSGEALPIVSAAIERLKSGGFSTEGAIPISMEPGAVNFHNILVLHGARPGLGPLRGMQ